MKKQLTKEQALYKITAYCSLAEHCLAEVRKKLAAWEMNEADCRSIIDYLLKEKYVDEERYACAFAREKMQFAKWGRTKVGFALRNKNIAQNIIDEVLEEVFSAEDYYDSIAQVLAAKFRSLSYKNKYDAKGKLLRFGAGRGFEFQKMMPVIDRLLNDVPGDHAGDFSDF